MMAGAFFDIAVIIRGKKIGQLVLLTTVGLLGVGRFLSLIAFVAFIAKGDDYSETSYLEFQQSTFTAYLDETNALITVIRRGEFRERAIVDYSVADGSAVAGEDYKPVGGQLVFDPMENKKTFIVPVMPRPVGQPEKTLHLILQNASSHAQIIQPEATLVITGASPQPANAPSVTIDLETDGTIAISWPGDRLDCVLERTEDISKPWVQVPTPPYQSEGRLIVEEPAVNSLFFYRLRVK